MGFLFQVTGVKEQKQDNAEQNTAQPHRANTHPLGEDSAQGCSGAEADDDFEITVGFFQQGMVFFADSLVPV